MAAKATPEQIWKALVKLAVSGETATYSEFGAQFGIYHRQVGAALEPIKKFCKKHKLPPLTVLVVRADSRRAGRGSDVSSGRFDAELERVFHFPWRANSTPQFGKPEKTSLSKTKSSKRAFNRKDFGAWVLKYDPAVFDLDALTENGETNITLWSIADNYRADEMQIGDKVVLWQSGKSGGVIGLGEIQGPPIPQSKVKSSSKGWKNKSSFSKVKLWADVEIDLLEEPILRERVAEECVLADAEIFRIPYASSPSLLTRKEFRAIERLITRPVSADDKPSVMRKTGAGYGSAEKNRLVEVAAVSIVIKELKKAQWRVVDVQSKNLGWDLTAKKGTQTRKIEVKGVSGLLPSVILTRNEHRAFATEKDWELAIVTMALSKHPHLRYFTRTEVRGHVEPSQYVVKMES
ncbi:MAG: hypothetical protein RL410_76 [Actinomycetota bacterium]|jgi:predicted RNA-binding protein with PUA-like domain